MTPTIAKTAHVSSQADIASDVYIGPGAVIEDNVSIGPGCQIGPNVVIRSGTRLGSHNCLHAHVILGEPPQIINLHDTDTELIIGDHNTFRENVTVNLGSSRDTGRTVIGSHNYLMIGSHIGHDCLIEDHVVLGNCSQISGHCKIESRAWLSAFCGTHQFVTVHRHTYLAGYTALGYDLPPFLKASESYPCRVRGVNTIGLQRAGFHPDTIRSLQRAYRTLYRHPSKSIAQGLADLKSRNPTQPEVLELIAALERSHQHRFGRYRESFRS